MCSVDEGRVPAQVGTLLIHRLDSQSETLPLPPWRQGDVKTTTTFYNRPETYLSISWSLSIRSIQATPQYMPFILRNSDIAYSKSSGSWPYLKRVASKGEPEANWFNLQGTWTGVVFKKTGTVKNHSWIRSLLCYESSMLVKQKRGGGTLGHICILHNNSHSCINSEMKEGSHQEVLLWYPSQTEHSNSRW